MACFESMWSLRACFVPTWVFFAEIGHQHSNCLIFTIFSFLSLVLISGIWLEAALLSDSSLSDMVPGLIDLQLDSKAPSMVLKYNSGWLRWRKWALSKIGVPVIPVKPSHIALFISELTKRSSENNIGVSPIESAVYAIKWGHTMTGIEACPVSHPLVKFALEGTTRPA